MSAIQAVDYTVCAFLVGGTATVAMDLWVLVRQHVFGMPASSYGLVGRWFLYMGQGRFHHDSIGASPPKPNERVVGWAAHYLIGIVFAAVLLAVWGLEWVFHPTIGAAMIVGIASVAAPFLLMQPGMGAGIAASRTARPAAARVQSLLTHAIFGLGLYGGGWVAKLLWL